MLNNRLNLNSHKIKAGGSNKSNKGDGFMFISFKSEEDKQTALKVLNGYCWKNKTLVADAALPTQDPLVLKRAFEEVDKGHGTDSGFRNSNESIEDLISRVTIPCYKIPYPEQVCIKNIMNERGILFYIYAI